MAARPGKLTEDTAKRILANLRQSGQLINAAAREGISKSTLFAWLKREERESSGLYNSFSRAVAVIGEERIASLALYHHRLATGCVMEMPARDKSGRMRCDAKGRQVISHVAFRPNRGAMEWELKRLDPNTYDVKKDCLSEAVVRKGRMKRPRRALPREQVGGLLEQGITSDEIDSGQSRSSRGRGRRCKLTPEMSARILGYYRQSGNLRNAALRAGVSKSTLFDWLQRAKQDDLEPYRSFLDAFELARAERVALLAIRHREAALGGVVQLPLLDRFGRQLYDAEGKPLFAPVLLRPNCEAMAWELERMDPVTYSSNPGSYKETSAKA
jgi:transposase-like protein